MTQADLLKITTGKRRGQENGRKSAMGRKGNEGGRFIRMRETERQKE